MNEEIAITIAELIKDMDVDDRGKLFEDIGMELVRQSQGYTGMLFTDLAKTYRGK